MESIEQRLIRIAPVFLRIGIAIVFIWFGIQQILHANAWVGFIPSWLSGLFSLSAITWVHINGAFEIVFGAALFFGIYTRLSAFLLAFHMIDITLVVGYTSVGVRDFGLAIASIAIFLFGKDNACVESKFQEIK